MGNTTWNPLDKGANITLTGGNLIATASTTTQGVRAVDKQTTGKFYFELTLTAGASLQALHGLANSSAILTSVASNPNNAIGMLGNSGTIFINLTNTGTTFGARSNGDILGIAADFTSNLVWFRIAPSGNWNNNASFAPGGTGGINFSSIVSTGLFPVFAVASTPGTAVTANFGDSAFVGVIPSGFFAGFPVSTVTVSGAREMSFTAGPTVVLGAGAAVALPTAVDVSGNSPGFTLYSHMRVPGGTTYTFDTGTAIVVPATTDSVISIPPAARFITATAASTVQFGQSL